MQTSVGREGIVLPDPIFLQGPAHLLGMNDESARCIETLGRTEKTSSYFRCENIFEKKSKHYKYMYYVR